MKTTSRHADEFLTFGIMLACAGAAIAALSIQMLAGFCVGVIVRLGAAVFAGADFD